MTIPWSITLGDTGIPHCEERANSCSQSFLQRKLYRLGAKGKGFGSVTSLAEFRCSNVLFLEAQILRPTCWLLASWWHRGAASLGELPLHVESLNSENSARTFWCALFFLVDVFLTPGKVEGIVPLPWATYCRRRREIFQTCREPLPENRNLTHLLKNGE